MPPFDPAFPDAHDPVMAKEGDTFYIFSTGLQELTTKDFRTYEKVEPPFREPASWVRPLIPQFKRHFWAPDVIFHGGKWHLFYCCSIFGKNVSVIGRMTRSTLDVSSDEPWKDEGLVIRSVPMRDNWNAIDPNIAIDVDSGRPWMVFGSFWDGIQIVKMSKDLSELKGSPKTIARRLDGHVEMQVEAGDNAIEAPFIFRHGDYYYLFVSWDYCCRGDNSTYKVVVGRSKNIDGPYLDRDGKDMLYGGGTLVVFNNHEFNAAGHCAAYNIDGKDYFLCHAYERENGASKLIVRPISWSPDGWPTISLDYPEKL